jgi:hypothetical protein
MELKDLKPSYDATLRNFRGLRQKLEAAHAPAPDTVERIISCAEEYGVEATLRQLGSNADQFGVRLPADAYREIAPLLQSLADGNGRLDQLTVQREKKLRESDPKRLPVYQWQGREFEVDAKKGTMTYLDAPDQPLRLELRVVHTKNQPDPGRCAPAPPNDRSRTRER